MIDHLLAVAEGLASSSTRKPKQADLRRAISTAYYALFHAIARSSADVFAGTVKARRDEEAWARVYRALDHGVAKSACQSVKNLGYSVALVQCANAFIDLQEARHEADYNPLIRLKRSEAKRFVDSARSAIGQLRGASTKERSRFGAHLLFKKR